MGFLIIRLIIFILVFWAGYRIWKMVQQVKKPANPPTRQEKTNQAGAPMVKCDYCGLHLPTNESLTHGTHLHFCCPEHRQHFLDEGPLNDKPQRNSSRDDDIDAH